MKNSIYKRLLEFVMEEKEDFDMLISADNVLGLNVSSEDIINFLDFSIFENALNAPILGNVLITEGDILSVLKIIEFLQNYSGEYTIYINEDNLGTNTYLISRANMIYKEYGLELNIKIDYGKNYNQYINSLVTIIGSDNFIKEAKQDFSNANCIVV